VQRTSTGRLQYLYVTVKCIVNGRFFPVRPRRGIENDHTFDQYLSVFLRDFLVLNSATRWVPFKSIKLASYLLGTSRLHSSRCEAKEEAKDLMKINTKNTKQKDTHDCIPS
jgi:hypothetical protein